jgi:hypothetical protein
VNFSFLSSSNKIPFLTSVYNPTHSNGMFDPFSYNNQLEKFLRKTSNQIFKVWCFESVGE